MTKTYRKKNNNTTRKNGRPSIIQFQKEVTIKFFEMLLLIKLFHWKTHSYATHKATDELYEKLNKNIDKFIETLLGKDESRIKLLKKRVDLLDTKNTNEFKSRIYEYREFLLDMNNIFNGKIDSDILSIRDEMLSDLNQFLYLLTFDK